ncbi:phosphotransferase [Streptomyces sp. NPDC048751]|uniref:phosphotransferase n=1 Tax=Streptomyces sp. NPDC048751 TaxID=3365591 RepID=UPI0037164FEF
MGAPPPPRPVYGGRPAPYGILGEFVGRAVQQGRENGGNHNLNHVLPATERVAPLLGVDPGTPVMVRTPRPGTLPVVIRTWENEPKILDAIGGTLPNVPRCLAKGHGFAIHTYAEGEPLSAVCPDDKPVDSLRVQELTGLLARTTQVRRAALPPLPAVWPRNLTDSQGFLRTLALLADEQVRKPNWPVFGGLFKALGIPEDALVRLAERVPSMARRPYALLHTDLHRDNVIVESRSEGAPLRLVDWELASYGDPLHDLATHLVRMRYPKDQWDEVTGAWEQAVRQVRPSAANGIHRDLSRYVDFERAQSLYPDVMRAARSLEDAPGEARLATATRQVLRALRAATRPLGLGSVPDAPEIERALFRWLASRNAGLRTNRGWVARAFAIEPDRRLPHRPDFPASAVRAALLAEGAAPANLVFKGTAHLNSVVRVPDVDFPVVVRRRLPHVCRRERSFLSEHAVLNAIHGSAANVAAPRALALGRSYGDEAFTVQTYVGPPDIDRPPNHPVHGLLPHEADGLVNQLCSLRHVRYKEVDPAAGEGSFFTWLCGQLVELVAELPEETQRMARHLGLPDAHRLAQILGRLTVSERRPALLHGDLNPWNLVRRDDALALTIIDWEMAVVGDPLYDLVRHLHLTPTRPEIRDRMFRRWAAALPPEYTVNWAQDWPVYRSIETVRSAYIDLDRLVTGASLDVPNVRRAVDSYAMTLAAATGSLGLPTRTATAPCLARAFA